MSGAAVPTVVLGKLVKAIGLHGELKLLPSGDFWEEALASEQLALLPEDEASGRRAANAVRVMRSRAHGRGLLALTLEGVTDRDAAQACVGRDLVLVGEALDVPAPRSLRPFQLLGCQVLLPDGSLLGVIEEVIQMPTQQLLLVRGASRQYQIPLVPEFVAAVDLAARVVRITPLPGLLEL